MKSYQSKTFMAAFAIALFSTVALAQTTAFSYQGNLNDGAVPANGNYEMEFKLFDALAGGTQIGNTVTDASVTVVNGTFAVTLDFEAFPFDGGAARHLEIAVRPAGNKGPHTILAPRQPIKSAPFAIQARNAATADNATNALQLGGIDASEYVTATSVGNAFIKNGTTLQPTSNFNISGNAIVGGSLGLGTAAPVSKLEVVAQDALTITGFQPFMTLRDTSTNKRVALQTADGGFIFYTNQSAGSQPSVFLRGTGSLGIGADPLVGYRLDVNGNTLIRNPGTGGNVQFGTPSGESGMAIIGANRADIRFDGETLKLLAGTGPGAMASTNGINVNRSGNVGIGVINPTQKLEVAGTTKTGILQITGGSDLAENFEFGNEEVRPGMVVAIDSQRPGKLLLARGEYNRSVAGVISGANDLAAGMILPDLKQGDNTMPVALSGRVWVYADATRNPIQPGDLLTTARTPGHAMKAANHRKAQGAILGKAMTALTTGRGLVLVLVTLQ